MPDIIKAQGGILDIDLGRCVHRLPYESAVGKTMISRVYGSDPSLGVRIVSLSTSADYTYIKRELDLCDSNTILLLDRFNLYATKDLWNLIKRNSDKCILIDYKGVYQGIKGLRPAFISRSERGLKIRDDYTR